MKFLDVAIEGRYSAFLNHRGSGPVETYCCEGDVRIAGEVLALRGREVLAEPQRLVTDGVWAFSNR